MSPVLVASPFTGRYVVDPDHSSFGFAVRHMGISTFRGSFAEITADVEADEHGALRITGAAAVESLSVRSPLDLRTHLLGDEFFDVARQPEITFASGPAQPAEGQRITVPGVLTIRNVARDVVAAGTWTSPVEDPFGGVRAALELTTTIDRRDFGMTWNMPLPRGGDALGAEVEISAHLELLAA